MVMSHPTTTQRPMQRPHIARASTNGGSRLQLHDTRPTSLHWRRGQNDRPRQWKRTGCVTQRRNNHRMNKYTMSLKLLQIKWFKMFSLSNLRNEMKPYSEDLVVLTKIPFVSEMSITRTYANIDLFCWWAHLIWHLGCIFNITGMSGLRNISSI